MPTALTVSLPGRAAPDLAAELARDLGAFPAIESDGDARGVDAQAVHIVIFAGVGTFLVAMVQQFGADAANRLIRLIERLRQAAPHAHPDVRLVDETHQVVIVLGPAAVEDPRAIASLLALERDVFRSGVELRWDPGTGRWQAHRP